MVQLYEFFFFICIVLYKTSMYYFYKWRKKPINNYLFKKAKLGILSSRLGKAG